MTKWAYYATMVSDGVRATACCAGPARSAQIDRLSENGWLAVPGLERYFTGIGGIQTEVVELSLAEAEQMAAQLGGNLGD